MSDTVCVDLHGHSHFSDGVLPPESLAERLAAAGVRAAALADHDTLEGLPAFRQALARHGIGFVPGLELTAWQDGAEVHLLAYGFDPEHAELVETLRSIRQARTPDAHNLAQAIRQKGRRPDSAAATAAPGGILAVPDALALIHRAGGRAFLAHPLAGRPDPGRLRPVLARLKEQGLDGLEAITPGLSGDQRAALLALAEEFRLLVCAGTDFHTADPGVTPGIEMPLALWKAFRAAVCLGGSEGRSAPAPDLEPLRAPAPRFDRRHFAWHILVPLALAMGLFIAELFAMLLPTFERTLLERKREMIRELVASAWSILAEAEAEERAGILTREAAQALALGRIQALRYGREGKDYFWLQDMHPRMIMHPYRTDLNGQDLTEFRDPRGVRIFVEFADLVRRSQEGYIDYVWQWKDDPHRLEHKESYIRGFAPWHWIIGTGIYLDDVHAEIARIERRLILLSVGLIVMVAGLLVYALRASLGVERERSRAEALLRDWAQRYRSMVEAATDGALLVLDRRISYANPVLLDRLGYAASEMEWLDLGDLLPEGEGNERAWAAVSQALAGQEVKGNWDGVLRHRDGTLLETVLHVNPIRLAGRSGLILLAQDIGARPQDARSEAVRAEHLVQAVETVPAGLFRARGARGGALLSANRAAREFLRALRPGPPDALPSLAEAVGDAADYEAFRDTVVKAGQAERVFRVRDAAGRSRAVRLAAVAVNDADGRLRFLDGLVEDVSGSAAREAERESLLERLQTSLLFLHAPVREVMRPVVACLPDTPLAAAAQRMEAQGAAALLVQGAGGEPLGLVTDAGFRRAMADGAWDGQAPVRRVMAAPLVTLPEQAQVYEALLRMEEKGVSQVVVEDPRGQPVGLLQAAELLQFQHYGPIVLGRDIARSATVEEVLTRSRRAPRLARTLLSGGAQPANVTRLIASVCDATTERLAALAQERRGPAPAAFAWIALGSQGRHEQTLCTDQDNALVFADPPAGADPAPIQAYFNDLGREVCDALDQAGYPRCRGNVMAATSAWCQPLAVWQGYFRDWILKAEPRQLLDMSVFFDLRAVIGSSAFVHALRREIRDALRQAPDFYPHFAQHALEFKPPFRLFGRILSGGGGDVAGGLDVKAAMMPIVSFARLYALRHDIEETHTVERIRRLAERQVIAASTGEDLARAYDTLMRLRLRHQDDLLQAGLPLDNAIPTRRLGHTDRVLLEQAFVQIEAVQQQIQRDFLGGAARHAAGV